MWDTQDEIETDKQLIISILNQTGINVENSQIRFVDCGNPHKSNYPMNHVAIYTFHYQGRFLKIGKVSEKNKSRFYSHHYHPSRNRSNLSKSILADPAMSKYNLDSETVGDWIRMNTKRVNLIIDAPLGLFALNLIEAILHALYAPKYEGKNNLRIDKEF